MNRTIVVLGTKGDHYLHCSRRSSESLVVGKERERGATIGADARKAHGIGMPPDGRKSNTLFPHRGSVSCQAASRGPSSLRDSHPRNYRRFISVTPFSSLSPSLFPLLFCFLHKFRRALAPSIQRRLCVGRSLNQSAATRAGPLMSLCVGFRSMHAIELISAKKSFPSEVARKNQKLKKKTNAKPPSRMILCVGRTLEVVTELFDELSSIFLAPCSIYVLRRRIK